MKYLILLLSLISFPVLAEKSVGCGPGNFVTTKNSLVATTTRSFTNAFCSMTVLGGMTSGTAGCSRHPIAKKFSDTEYFAMANFDVLHLEMAEGKGDVVSSFAHTFDCDPNGTQLIIKEMKRNYTVLDSLSERSSRQLLERVNGMIKSNQQLSKHCNTVIL